MDGVTILEIDPKFRILGRLDAARAHWTRYGWEFERGMFREFAPEGGMEAVPFTLTSLELEESIETFTQSQQPPGTMSFRDLRDYVNKLRESGHQVEKYLVQLYSKLSFPLIHVILVFVAIPLALQWPQGGPPAAAAGRLDREHRLRRRRRLALPPDPHLVIHRGTPPATPAGLQRC